MGGIAKTVKDQMGGAGQGGQPGGSVGSIAGAVAAGVKDAQLAHLQQQVDRLTKLVHILWKEAERLESMVHVTHEGLQIKTGMSEVLVLKNGGIVLQGQRVLLKSAGKQELML